MTHLSEILSPEKIKARFEVDKQIFNTIEDNFCNSLQCVYHELEREDIQKLNHVQDDLKLFLSDPEAENIFNMQEILGLYSHFHTFVNNYKNHSF